MHNNPRISRKTLDEMLASKLNTPSNPCLGCDEWRVIAINLVAILKEREGECDEYEAEIEHAVDYCETYAPKDDWADGLCPQAAALDSEPEEASLGTCPNCCDRPIAPSDDNPLVISIGGMECDGNELCKECREQFGAN